jgi:hypothetical protein
MIECPRSIAQRSTAVRANPCAEQGIRFSTSVASGVHTTEAAPCMSIGGKQVLAVAPDVHVLVGVDPDPAADQKRGVPVTDVAQHLLEGLAVQQRDRKVVAFRPGHLLGDL